MSSCPHIIFVHLWKRFCVFQFFHLCIHNLVISAVQLPYLLSFIFVFPLQCSLVILKYNPYPYSLQFYPFLFCLSLLRIFFSSVFPEAPTVVHKDPREQRKTHWNSLYLNNTHTASQTHSGIQLPSSSHSHVCSSKYTRSAVKTFGDMCACICVRVCLSVKEKEKRDR